MAVFAFILSGFNLSIAQTAYNWKSVAINGGGLVSGLIYHPTETDLLYARTDVGGAYRWDAANKKWIAITDGMTSGDDHGVWSLAVDPSDAKKVYIATGLYSASWGSNGVIYGSNDKGTTWTKLANLSFKLGGNDPGRGTCERLVVDPNKSSVLFLGSKKDGLYKSTDSGVNWTKVSSFASSYITFVEFDKSTGTSGNATQTIYVGVADYIYNNGNVGVYVSKDGGATWAKMTNHPTALPLKSKDFDANQNATATVPSRLVISGNYIYVTFNNSVTPNGDYQLSSPHSNIINGALYKFNKTNNTWTNISPAVSLQGGYGSVAVSPTDANKIVLTTAERWWPSDEVYFSADGGTNWSSTFNSFNYASTWGNSYNKGAYSVTKAPYASSLNVHWITSVAMNPARNNEIMFTTGFGVFACYNVSSLFTNANSNNTAATTWTFENDGLEETVPLELVSPPSGNANLVSAIGDFDGFQHLNLDISPVAGRYKTNNTTVGTTRSIAFAESVPTKMVKAFDNDSYKKGAYSTDGGATWTAFASKPSGVGSSDQSGKITISADGKNIVWAPEKGSIAYSTNDGGSWTNSNGNVPVGLKPVADRVNSKKFYVYDAQTSKAFYSTDGGANFTSVTLTGSNVASYNAWQTDICAVFGQEGHVFVAGRENGLYRSINSGTSYTKISSVTEAYKVSVGKASANSSYPTIYIWGVVGGVNGLYRSIDQGVTWSKINTSAQEFGRGYNCLAGDPRVYGRLYIGAGARGIMYGEPVTVTGIDEDNFTESSSLSAYPNPFETSFKVNVEGEFDYIISEISGKVLSKGKANASQELGATLSQGLYLLQVNGKVIRLIKR